MWRNVCTFLLSIPGLLTAALALPAGLSAQEEPAHDPLPPPLVAPEIVPPSEGLVLAPLSGPAITFEERVVEIVNLERAAQGLPPLKAVGELFDSAGAHSFNMADRDFFAHCDPDDQTQPWDRMFLFGYDWNAAGENIAGGYSTPEDAMEAWMASLFGHRENILSLNFREIGVGYFEPASDADDVRLDSNQDCTVDGTRAALFRYWTQNFGSRSGVYPLVINRESHDTVCAELQLHVYGPPDAAEMRFSNDGVSWSAWEPYSPTKLWTLPGASGSPATVFSEVRNGSTVSAQDEIVLGSGFPATSNVNVPQQTVSTTETFQACDTVSATSGFEVTGTGDVTFHAGRRIVLGDGFSVASGGTFRAIVDSTL